MKHIRSVSLALVAVFAVSVAAAASASAAQPEFGGATFPVTFKGKGGPGTLETTLGLKVTCEKDTITASLESAIKLGKVFVTLEGCKTTVAGIALTCGTGGTIKTNELSAVLWLEPGTQKTTKEPVIVLTPASFKEAAVNFAKITCENASKIKETLTVQGGSLIGKISPKNTSTKNFKLTFNQTGGVQELLKLENSSGTVTPKFLETKGEETLVFGFTQSGVQGTEEIETSAAVELKS